MLLEIAQCSVFLYLNGSYQTLRRIVQGMYIISLILCANVMAVYVYSKLKRGFVVSARVIGVLGIPAIIGALTLIVGRIYYATGYSGNYYNFGPAVKISYGIGLFYVMVSLISVVIFRKRLRYEEKACLLAGLVIWMMLLLFQFFTHGIQVSSIAMMLMALIMFVGVENPREYYEKNLKDVRNEDAFMMMLQEKMGVKKSFIIASVIFTGKSSVMTGEDRQKLIETQEMVEKSAYNLLGESAFLPYWNTVSFFIKRPEKAEELMALVNHLSNESANYRMTYVLFDPLKYTSSLDEALQVLNYVSTDYVYTQSAPNMVIDGKIVDKMIYRNNVESIVKKAIEERAFDVYYQPILSVEDGRFTSAEALVRLRRPDTENFVSPEDFIPIAEKCGLVQQIDDIVFEKVCSFIARENLSSYGITHIEVNLSGNEVVDRQTHERLISKLEKYHISPDFINFEITETAYINNDDVFKENIQKLRDKGSTFSMDDFGSGYSNLLELLKMEYVMVKMDKEFIWNCLDPAKPDNMRMLDYSIGFLKEYGLHILAEGVETVEQAELLIGKGVEFLQGFYYSRPIPEYEYLEFLKAQKGERK